MFMYMYFKPHLYVPLPLGETMRHHKINYSDPGVDDVVMGQVWQNLLEQNEPSSDDLLAAIKMGK